MTNKHSKQLNFQFKSKLNKKRLLAHGQNTEHYTVTSARKALLLENPKGALDMSLKVCEKDNLFTN